MARFKRNKKVEEELPTAEDFANTEETQEEPITTDTQTRKMKVVNMDKKLEEIKPASGLTSYQQYMRDKIKNASKKA